MSTRYQERLWPPLRWWLLAALAMVTVAAILWSAVPGVVAAGAGVVLLAGSAWSLTAYAPDVRVDDGGLRAGPATLPWSAIGAVRAVDRADTRHLLGQGADPTAYLLLRGYVPAGVRIDVNDPDDPTPYWFVSTRRPQSLVASLTGVDQGTRS